MVQQRHRRTAERRLCTAATGILTVLTLTGCVSSALETSMDPKGGLDVATVAPASGANVKPEALAANAAEVEIKNGDAVTADQQAVIAAATDKGASPSLVPESATAYRSTRSPEHDIQVALNAARGSIFSTTPPKPEEAEAAMKSGVTVPTSVPAPSFNPAIVNIYSAPEQETAKAAHEAAPKTGRITDPADAVQLASLITPQAENPAAVPTPTEPPLRDFNADRFSTQQKSATIAPANPLTVATPQPGNPLSATPDDGSRPVAKLNAFFPPKPSAAEGEGDDGASNDDGDDGEPAGLMRLISAPGLARVAPNGIWIQTPYVETDCFKPELMKMLHTVEKHFGKPPIVTSGYRPPVWNAKAGGASHSLHTTCDAADIQVNGVSKWELANYLRSLPDRGGVGTYCYTNSVHVDTGNQRDWDWRCRRKTKRR